MLKYTQYFLHTRQRPDRAAIRDEWIEAVLAQPAHTQPQSDGRIRKWGWTPPSEDTCA